MDKEARFYQIYSNIPLAARDEIIVVINDEPLTWRAVRLEVDNKTDKAKEILEKLVELGILK